MFRGDKGGDEGRVFRGDKGGDEGGCLEEMREGV